MNICLNIGMFVLHGIALQRSQGFVFYGVKRLHAQGQAQTNLE